VLLLKQEVSEKVLEYIAKVQRAFIEQKGFREDPNKPGIPLEVRNGTYLLRIDGKLDLVKIKRGKIYCQNFDRVTVGNLRQQTALMDAYEPVVVIVKDERLKALLEGSELVVKRVYPDTTDADGDWTPTFKIEIELSK
jgi:hypothetical protein